MPEVCVARVNVDDEWFITDPRRPKLIALVGCVFKADGMALAAWRLAQRYWRDNHKHIPDDIWRLSDLEPLIEAKLAHRSETGIYVCGTEVYVEWLTDFAALGSKGGKASVESRRRKYGTAEPASNRLREPASKHFDENHEATNPHTLPLPPNLSPNGESGTGVPDCANRLVELWNANRGALPEIRKLTETLRRQAKTRWREEPDEAYWLSCVRKMAGSDFVAKSGWGSLHWLLKNDTNHAKVAAGNYDNRGTKAKPPTTETMLTEADYGSLLD